MPSGGPFSNLSLQKQVYYITFTSAKTQTPPQAPLPAKLPLPGRTKHSFCFPPHPGVPSSLAAIFILPQPTSHPKLWAFSWCVNPPLSPPTIHLKQLITVIYSEKDRLPQALPHLHAPGILGAWLPYVVLQIDIESLFGGSSRGMEKAMATHSSTLAWKIPWAEEPGRLQSMGSRRVGHNWVTSLLLFTFMHWRRKWQPAPVFLPGESQGRWSLVCCCLCGHTESDMTEAT